MNEGNIYADFVFSDYKKDLLIACHRETLEFYICKVSQSENIVSYIFCITRFRKNFSIIVSSSFKCALKENE